MNFSENTIFSLPCYTIVSSLFAPWAIVPSKLPGLGFTDWKYFLTWLYKYPNFYGINFEVLLGICCLVGVAITPTAWATLNILNKSSRLQSFFASLNIINMVHLSRCIWNCDSRAESSRYKLLKSSFKY